MPRPSYFVIGSFLLFATCFETFEAVAEDIPISVLRDWQDFNNSGWLAFNNHDYIKAESRFRAAINAVRPYEVQDQRLTARSYGDLARTLYHQKRYADAEPLARWSLSVREAHPRVNPNSVVQSLYVLAMIERAQRRYDQAETLLKKALALQEKHLVPGHPDQAVIIDEMAVVAAGQGRNSDADRLFTWALKIRQEALPAEHADIIESLEHYAAFLRRTKRVADAEPLETRVKAIYAAQAQRAAQARAVQQRSQRQGLK